MLLKPENVLPEFIFHIRLQRADGAAAADIMSGEGRREEEHHQHNSSSSSSTNGFKGGQKAHVPSALFVDRRERRLEDVIAHYEPGLELVLRDMEEEESFRDEFQFQSHSTLKLFTDEDDSIGMQFMRNQFNAAAQTQTAAASPGGLGNIAAAADDGGALAQGVQEEEAITQAIQEKLSLSTKGKGKGSNCNSNSNNNSSSSGGGSAVKTSSSKERGDGHCSDSVSSSPRAKDNAVVASSNRTSPVKKKGPSEDYSTFKRKQALLSSILGAVEDYNRRKLEMLRRTYIRLFNETDVAGDGSG